MNNVINIDFKDVARLLRMLRESEHLTQDDVAKSLKVSKAAVSLWESGEYGIKTSSLCDLADFYNISVEELILGKLNEESDLDVFKRNYDLSQWSHLLEMGSDNAEELCLFLDKCLLSKKTFFENYYNWMSGNTTQYVSDKMEYLSKFFEYTPNFGYGLYMELVHELNFIDDLNEDNNIKNPNYYNYRMEQAFKMIVNIDDFSKVFELHNDKVMNKYLAIIPQHRKDIILTSMIENRIFENEKIEGDPFIEQLIKNGTNCLFFNDCNLINYGDISFCEGISVDQFKDKAEDILKSERRKLIPYDQEEAAAKQDYLELNRFYGEYLSLVDKTRTAYLKNVIEYKNKEPLNYLYNLIKLY